MDTQLSRRELLQTAAASTLGMGSLAGFAGNACAARDGHGAPIRDRLSFKLLLASSLYGKLPVQEIIEHAPRCGAAAIDLWPLPHGNQREQVREMGDDRFAQLLEESGVSLGCVTQFKLGPFALQDEMRWASQFGCETIVTGSRGPKDLGGAELKKAVAEFVEKLKPQLETAEETRITIAIENHSNSLLHSIDSIRYLLDARPSQQLAVALAPYHLPQDAKALSDLIRQTGSGLELFYAWQYGKGCMEPLPKEEELLQMPGRGPLDFEPIVEALSDINYSRWTEIFMHPVPRGIPILDTAAEVTAEVNLARDYLEALNE